MLTKDRVSTIYKLAIPVGIALSSSVIMSLIDIAMVGKFGTHALAAVGLSIFGNTLVLAFVSGILPAVQGIVARRRGENSAEPRCLPLNGGLLLALVAGIPLTLLCTLLTPLFFSHISHDAQVVHAGIPYLRTLYFAIIAVGMNNAFQGYWAGSERPGVFMGINLLMDGLHVVLNYILMFGHFGAPAMGATGAAISTVISLYSGVLINFLITSSAAKNQGFLTARPQKALLLRIFQSGMPATMQQFFFSAGYLVFLWLVGQTGTADLAAANILVRVSLLLLLLAMSLGNASATLVSKSVGEGDLTGASGWGWDCGKLGVICITLLGLPFLFFPKFFLRLTLSDPQTLSLAVVPLQLVAATAGLGSLIYIFAYTLYSVGDGNRVLLISFSTQWLFFLPAVWFIGPHLHRGLLEITLVQAVYGALATALITLIWAGGRWKTIKI